MAAVPHKTPAAPRPSAVSRYVAWAGSVGELCDVVDRLKGLAAELGTPSPEGAEWYGQLFGKLRPQVTREPVMVAAVCGGTNTGKSLVSNVLVGAEISRSLPEAARTRCPVASLPCGLAGSVDLAALFPGFTPRAWSSDTDALGGSAAGDDLLVWREDPAGRQPARLILIDTPDVDGTLRPRRCATPAT